ncbi:hypothetical protein [Sinomicrobium sp.]
MKKTIKIFAPLLLFFAGLVQVQAQLPIYDASLEPINFKKSDASRKAGSSDTSAGAVFLYENVITIEVSPGVFQQIDAIVRTIEVEGMPFQNYDRDDASGLSNGPSDPGNDSENWFISEFGRVNSGGGHALFEFQFITGGSFDDNTLMGDLVILQNIYVNSYDIDGAGSGGSNQFSEFGGFGKREWSTNPNNTYLEEIYNEETGLTRFRSTVTTNNGFNPGTANGDRYRVRVTYDEMSTFRISVGADGGAAAYFGLDFSAGVQWANDPNVASAPVLDLNNNDNNFCVGPCPTFNEGAYTGSPINFTTGTNSNIDRDDNSSDPISNLTIRFNTVDIADGSDEHILVDGASSGGIIPLDFSDGANIPNITLGGVTYEVEAIVENGEKQLVFTNSSGGGTFSKTDAESLIDALQYENTTPTSTEGMRTFRVSFLQGVFQSNTANFYANILPAGMIVTNPMLPSKAKTN